MKLVFSVNLSLLSATLHDLCTSHLSFALEPCQPVLYDIELRGQFGKCRSIENFLSIQFTTSRQERKCFFGVVRLTVVTDETTGSICVTAEN